MKGFVLRRLNSEYELENFNYNIKGFCYPIKKTVAANLKVKEVIIVNEEIVSCLICHNFYKKYQNIVNCLLDNSDFDAEANAGTNLMLALDEVAHLRTIIIKKYQKYLKKKVVEELLKKLKVLENELRIKIIDYKLIKEQELVNDKTNCKSR